MMTTPDHNGQAPRGPANPSAGSNEPARKSEIERLAEIGRAQAYKVAGLLCDSIADKRLPLGPHVLIHPAHGAGSVCGSGIARREVSTLGYEHKSIPLGMIPAFAGWFLSYDHPIGLVAESPAQVVPAVTHLSRIGYDNVRAWLKEGIHGWTTSGHGCAGLEEGGP